MLHLLSILLSEFHLIYFVVKYHYLHQPHQNYDMRGLISEHNHNIRSLMEEKLQDCQMLHDKQQQQYHLYQYQVMF